MSSNKYFITRYGNGLGETRKSASREGARGVCLPLNFKFPLSRRGLNRLCNRRRPVPRPTDSPGVSPSRSFQWKRRKEVPRSRDDVSPPPYISYTLLRFLNMTRRGTNVDDLLHISPHPRSPPSRAPSRASSRIGGHGELRG